MVRPLEVFINYFARVRTISMTKVTKKMPGFSAWHPIELAEYGTLQIYSLKRTDLNVADVVLVRKKDHYILFIQLAVFVIFIGNRQDILRNCKCDNRVLIIALLHPNDELVLGVFQHFRRTVILNRLVDVATVGQKSQPELERVRL